MMGALRYVGDSLRNLVANLGTSRDKAAHSFYDVPVLTDQEASNAYRGAWLPRKIVDIPALDACRKWRSWHAEAGQISAIESEETRLGLQGKVLDALIKARLTGGAAIYIGTGDSDPSKPLDPQRIGSGGIKHLTVLTKRVLAAGEFETDPDSPAYGQPAYYTMSAGARHVEIHPSRLVRFVGARLPDDELAAGPERGWGDSVLTAVMAAIKNADSTAGNIASLVFEAKVDVIKVPGLMARLASDPTFADQVLSRLQLAATAKGINGTLLMDAEEEYEQKSASFSTLPDILREFLQLVCGAADIPATRLLGQAPGGLNSSGEVDLRNYYDRLQSTQTLVIGPTMALLDECLIRSALGARPPEVFYEWRSLWQTTDRERADIGKTTADSIKTIAETRLIPDDVLSEVAVNMLTEVGAAPGLEAAMAGYASVQPGETGEDDRAALGLGDAKSGYDPAQPRDRSGKWVAPGGSDNGIETGPFGPIFTQFRHDAAGAIAHLREQQTGEAVAALHHPEVGDIDLVWGEVGDPAKGYKGGFGLAKISAKHPEALTDLQGFVSGLRVTKRDSTWITMEDERGKGIIRLDWDGQTKHWLVSAYEKRAGGRTTSDTAALVSAGDTARRATGSGAESTTGVPDGVVDASAAIQARLAQFRRTGEQSSAEE